MVLPTGLYSKADGFTHRAILSLLIHSFNESVSQSNSYIVVVPDAKPGIMGEHGSSSSLKLWARG